MSKQAKTAKKSLTIRQAQIKAASLMRSFDTSMARIKKETATVADTVEQFRSIVLPALEQANNPSKEEPAAKAKSGKAKAKSGKANGKAEARNPSSAAQNAKPPVKGRPTIKAAISTSAC